MKSKLTTLFALFFSILIYAQDGLPDDYLTSEFHKNRREAFRAGMPDNSVAVFFANALTFSVGYFCDRRFL